MDWFLLNPSAYFRCHFGLAMGFEENLSEKAVTLSLIGASHPA